ncbi:MAG: glycogen/starch synthase [Acutalibacteraceae bacterium]
MYLKYKYGLTPGYAEIKTVFTIHNIAYQGVRPTSSATCSS